MVTWIEGFKAWAEAYEGPSKASNATGTVLDEVESFNDRIKDPLRRAANKINELGGFATFTDLARMDCSLDVYASKPDVHLWRVFVYVEQHLYVHGTVRTRDSDERDIRWPTDLFYVGGATDGRCHLQALSRVLEWADAGNDDALDEYDVNH